MSYPEFVELTIASYAAFADAKAMKTPQFVEFVAVEERFIAEGRSNLQLFKHYLSLLGKTVRNSKYVELVAKIDALVESNPEFAKLNNLAKKTCYRSPEFQSLLAKKIYDKLESTPKFRKVFRARATPLKHIQCVVIKLPIAGFIYISKILTKFGRKIRSIITF